MKKQTKKPLWRGLTSTSAVLMVVSLIGTQCAITYTGTLNSYLGTTTRRIVSTGDTSAEDTNYYTSEVGDYSAENLQSRCAAGVCLRWCNQRRSVHRYISNRSVSGVEGCRFLYQ